MLKKILLANVDGNAGSTGKITHDLYTSLNGDGYQAAIAHGRGMDIHEPGVFKFGIPAETYIHAGLARLTGYNGRFSPLSTRRLLRFIDNYQPDIVNLHEMYAYFVDIGTLIRYLRENHIPTVWTLHCEEMYTGKCGHAFECTRYKTGCGHCPAVHEYPKSLWVDHTHELWEEKQKLFEGWAVTLVTPSQWLADRVKGSFLRDKRLEVIHNGIDTSIFHPQDASSLRREFHLEGKKVVLSVMPDIHNKDKGADKVLAISKLMPDIQFVIAGADKTETYTDNCLLIQRTRDQNRLAEWYSLADVYLICSKRENFPTTCIEAMCCGAPVVGIDGGGTKETVPSPYGVFCPESEDLTELCEAIRRQIMREYTHESIGAQGIRRYSAKVMYQHYLELFHNVNSR